MASVNNVSIQRIMKLKKENAELEELVNFLRMESFELSLKCNQIENAISNIKLLVSSHPAKMVDVSENLCSILQSYSSVNPGLEPRSSNENMALSQTQTPIKLSPSVEKARSNKAHVVKPHMVNGHILYIPTINLTRVNDSNSGPNSENSILQNSHTLEQNNSGAQAQGAEEEMETDNSEQDFHVDSQISHLEDVSEASTSRSPSHSTVLSGTFQEVKIYLNQIGQDSINEELRKSVNARRNLKALRSSNGRFKSSIGGSSDNITRRVKRS